MRVCAFPVTSVKFAVDDKSRLACCSMDGKISILQLIPPPATQIATLQGHRRGITGKPYILQIFVFLYNDFNRRFFVDFVWSTSNDTILSASLDGTVRLWSVAKGVSLREVADPTSSEIYRCAFQPINNNLAAVSLHFLDHVTHRKTINLYLPDWQRQSCCPSDESIYRKSSQGKKKHVMLLCKLLECVYGLMSFCGQGGSGKVMGKVHALCFDTTGHVLWSGDDRGFVVSFLFDMATGKINKAKKYVKPVPCCWSRTIH